MVEKKENKPIRQRLREIFNRLEDAVKPYPYLWPLENPDQMKIITELYNIFGVERHENLRSDQLVYSAIYTIIWAIDKRIDNDYFDTDLFVDEFMEYLPDPQSHDDDKIFILMMRYLISDNRARDAIAPAIEELRKKNGGNDNGRDD